MCSFLHYPIVVFNFSFDFSRGNRIFFGDIRTEGQAILTLKGEINA